MKPENNLFYLKSSRQLINSLTFDVAKVVQKRGENKRFLLIVRWVNPNVDREIPLPNYCTLCLICAINGQFVVNKD